MSVSVQAERVDVAAHVRKTIDEQVAIEALINIHLNDKRITTLRATPKLRKESALGWLFDEGILRSLDEIKEVIVNQNDVKVTTREPLEEGRYQIAGAIRTLAATSRASLDRFMEVWLYERSSRKFRYEVSANSIIKMVRELERRSKLFRLTGGTHAAALFEEEEMIAFAEDVSRHSAIDKVVGMAVQSKADFSKCVLVSSGRQSADMVLKAVIMRIPILVSKASPIHSGIIMAEKAGLTLICFAREQRMNVYTYPGRVLT